MNKGFAMQKLAAFVHRQAAKNKPALIAGGLIAAFTLGVVIAPGKAVHSTAGAGERDHADHPSVWTCSMHPQIQLTEPGQCPICFMDLIPLAETGGGEDVSGRPTLTMSKAAKTFAGIATAPVIRKSVYNEVRMAGKVDYDETRVELITAWIAGRIDRLYVDYAGVPVKRGDHLARVYSPELVSLQRELLEASRMTAALPPNASSLVRSGARQSLKAAEKKMALLGFSQDEIDAVLNRGATSEHMTIRAGQEGVIVQKFVREGAYVEVGAPLYEIADLKKVWVRLDAYESDLVWLRLGQAVSFEVQAWPGELFEGVISFIDPVVDPSTRTVMVRVIVDNHELRLKPDMFVRAVAKAGVSAGGGVKNAALAGKWVSPMHPQIVKDKPGVCDICGMPLVPAEELGYAATGQSGVDPLLIPATAPLLTGARAVVYVEDPRAQKPTYEGREVLLGPRAGDWYVVKSGLAEGERVVVNGAFKIDGELQIRAKPSMMNPATNAASFRPKASGQSDRRKSAVQAIATRPPDEEFLAQLTPLYERYLAGAEALADDDFRTARTALTAAGKAVASVDAPRTQQYQPWRSAAEKLSDAFTRIQKAESMNAVRAVFETISDQIIVLEKHYGHAGERERFLAYCPMAFDNKGAYWLQNTTTINNPYYGARMLRCGEIRDTIKQNMAAKQDASYEGY